MPNRFFFFSNLSAFFSAELALPAVDTLCVAALPPLIAAAPVLIAAEVEGITSKLVVTSKAKAKTNLRFTRKHYLLATLDHNTHNKRVATVVIPVSTVVTNRFPSSRNLVPTPPIRIPMTVATLFSRIVFFT